MEGHIHCLLFEVVHCVIHIQCHLYKTKWSDGVIFPFTSLAPSNASDLDQKELFFSQKRFLQRRINKLADNQRPLSQVKCMRVSQFTYLIY